MVSLFFMPNFASLLLMIRGKTSVVFRWAPGTLLFLLSFAVPPGFGRSPEEVQVTGIEHQVAKDRVRVVLRCDAPVEYVGGTATNPSRIFFDLQGTRPAASLAAQFPVGDSVVQRVRVGRNRPGVTRMVLDLTQAAPYTATFVANPPRLIIEVMRAGAASEAHTEAHTLVTPSHKRLTPPPRTPPVPRKAKLKVPPPAPIPEPPPPVALNPEQMPPAPPQVTYQNGLLTIVANNCTLSDVLHAVAARTGATIDAPPTLTGQRVAAHLGPGAPQDVMADLLSGFDYIVVGNNNDPNSISSIVVSANNGSESPPSVAPPPPPPEPPEPTEPEQAAPQQTPVPPPGEPGSKTPAQTKSPEELLEELRKLQEQQQQQQQQQPK